jgi:hypothetical protein
LIPIQIIDYIKEYILLKNEELNLIDSTENNGIIDIPVIKRTARTRRTVAKLTLGLNNTPSPPNTLVKSFNSPKSKKQLRLSNQTYEWIRNGWVIREYRLQKDERTIKSEQYRMGYELFHVQQQSADEKVRKNKEQILEWRTKWIEINESSKEANAGEYDVIYILRSTLKHIDDGVKKFIEKKVDKLEEVNPTWSFQKQVLFYHFLLALYQIAIEEKQFDWKQIGARYFRKIGGSKEFDTFKSDFIKEAEQLLERPLQLLGLVSLGTVTPIFFTGPLVGNNATYKYGSVHATTDLAVFTDTFQTDAKVLWLVENRGVLTRMTYEIDFLVYSESLVLGIDGHLRSGHRKLIENLVPHINQVIIWTDVDEAGFIIAKGLSQLINDDVLTKWVIPSGDIVTEFEQFEIRYKHLIQNRKIEQEQEIGGVEHWKKWINL